MSGPRPFTPRYFDGALLKALGFDGHLVTRIELVVDIHEPVRITVTEFVGTDRAEALVRVLGLGSWQEIPGDDRV